MHILRTLRLRLALTLAQFTSVVFQLRGFNCGCSCNTVVDTILDQGGLAPDCRASRTGYPEI